MASGAYSFEIPVAGEVVHVRRKRVKNMNLRVTGAGVVELSIPRFCSRADAERFVASKKDWIARSLARARRQTDAVATCRYLDGDVSYLWGKPYSVRLETIGEGRPSYELDADRCLLTLCVPDERTGEDDESVAYRRRLIVQMRKDELLRALPEVARRCEGRVGASCDDWHVRDMRTRWGSCVVKRRRIWLSAELATREPECLEGVVCHELCHLIVPNHSAAFYAELERSFPDWRRVRAELRQSPRLP